MAVETVPTFRRVLAVNPIPVELPRSDLRKVAMPDPIRALGERDPDPLLWSIRARE
jgi:hypothetical protein